MKTFTWIAKRMYSRLQLELREGKPAVRSLAQLLAMTGLDQILQHAFQPLYLQHPLQNAEDLLRSK